MDWTVLEIDGVMGAVEYAADTVAHRSKYATYVEYEDVLQEAQIIAAKQHERLRECVAGEGEGTLGSFQYELTGDLLNHAESAYRRATTPMPDGSRARRMVSADYRYAEVREDSSAPARVALPMRQDKGLYTRDLVESLLPAVWDPSYCYGMQAENAPDADMPRGSINKATGNTLAAHLVDIRVGWEKTDLTMKERRALFLTYCMDWTQNEVAYNQECSQKVISERLATAVGKVVAQLNGVDWHNWEEVAA